MDLITRHEDQAATRSWGMHGTAAAAAMERARSSRRPARLVLFDARSRSGGRAGPGGGTYQSGLFGEEVVADRLVDDGWRLLGHRVRTRVGELDLVARRGDTVVFAEVKTARPGRLGVEEAVDGRTRHRIRRAAVAWMASNPRLQAGVRRYRFDVFVVRLDDAGVVERVDHVPDAF
jgi:putative endonuclease